MGERGVTWESVQEFDDEKRVEEVGAAVHVRKNWKPKARANTNNA